MPGPLFIQFDEPHELMKLYEYQQTGAFENIDATAQHIQDNLAGTPAYEWKGTLIQWLRWIFAGGSFTQFTVEILRQGQKVQYVYYETTAKEFLSRVKNTLQRKLKIVIPENMAREAIPILFQTIIHNTRNLQDREGRERFSLISNALPKANEIDAQAVAPKQTSKRTELAKKKLAEALSKTGETYGQAIDNGDCFYDAIAQRLTATLKRPPAKPVTIQELRRVVARAVEKAHRKNPTGNWIYAQLINRIDAGNPDYDDLRSLVGKPVNELSEKEVPIWGRLQLEGQIIAEHYKTQIQLCEITLVDTIIPLREFRGLSKEYDGMRFDIALPVEKGKKMQLYKACEPNWVEVNPTSSKPLHTIRIALYPGHFVPIQPANEN